jgi:hypothetical protein
MKNLSKLALILIVCSAFLFLSGFSKDLVVANLNSIEFTESGKITVEYSVFSYNGDTYYDNIDLSPIHLNGKDVITFNLESIADSGHNFSVDDVSVYNTREDKFTVVIDASAIRDKNTELTSRSLHEVRGSKLNEYYAIILSAWGNLISFDTVDLTSSIAKKDGDSYLIEMTDFVCGDLLYDDVRDYYAGSLNIFGTKIKIDGEIVETNGSVSDDGTITFVGVFADEDEFGESDLIGFTDGVSDDVIIPKAVWRVSEEFFKNNIGNICDLYILPTKFDEFTDVKSTIFYDDLERMYAAGIMNGTSEYTMSPDDFVTREQAIVLLKRFHDSGYLRTTTGDGEPISVESLEIEPWNTNLNITDVSDTRFSYEAIKWGISSDIMHGVSTDTENIMFDPKGMITREQVLVMLYNYIEKISVEFGGFSVESNFGDVAFDVTVTEDYGEISDWASEAIKYAQGFFILDVYGDNLYDESINKFYPKQFVTRGEFAGYLNKILEDGSLWVRISE